MNTPCTYCGKPMQNRVRTRARFCSISCKDRAHAKARQSAKVLARGERHCLQCEQPIDPSRHGQSRFCSQRCYARNYNIAKAARLKAERLAKVGPCRICGAVIPANRTARAVYCSDECLRVGQAEKHKLTSPGYMRQRLYGITHEQFQALADAQDNRCAICRTDTPGGKGGWHVDHDHGTKAIRGLLCHHCNLMLGNAKDDPNRLLAAVAYLKR